MREKKSELQFTYATTVSYIRQLWNKKPHLPWRKQASTTWMACNRSKSIFFKHYEQTEEIRRL